MIGPSLPPIFPRPAAGAELDESISTREHSRGVVISAVVVERPARIGPALPPGGVAAAAGIAFREEHSRSKVSTPKNVPFGPFKDTPLASAVVACRRGELPVAGSVEHWSETTRKAALIAALEVGQMHVVFALRPRSEAWRASLGWAEGLDQSELDRLLRHHAMGKAGKQHAREAIEWLLEEGASLESLCSSEASDVRAAASTLLTTLGDGAAVRAASLLASDDWRARTVAAEALGKLPRDAAAPHAEALAALLEDESAVARMAAVTSLGRLGVTAAGHCAAALASEKPRVREAAAEALGRLGTAASPHVEALAGLLADSDWQVPTAAANALKRLGAEIAAPHCASVLGRCEHLSQGAAAEAMVRLGGAAAAEAAAGLLSSADAGVRRHASDVLASIGKPHAAPHVQALRTLVSQDEDREVRRVARTALSKLGETAPLPEVVGNGDELPEFGKGRHCGKGSGKHSKTTTGSSKNNRGAKGDVHDNGRGPHSRSTSRRRARSTSHSNKARNNGSRPRRRGTSRERARSTKPRSRSQRKSARERQSTTSSSETLKRSSRSASGERQSGKCRRRSQGPSS